MRLFPVLTAVLLGLGVLGLACPRPVLAAPGLCIGPVCGDEITRKTLADPAGIEAGPVGEAHRLDVVEQLDRLHRAR